MVSLTNAYRRQRTCLVESYGLVGNSAVMRVTQRGELEQKESSFPIELRYG